MKLITIPMSHYCEKARWGLEYAGIAYREEAHLQGFHYLAVAGKKSGGMVPVLSGADICISESSRILKWIDRSLAAERKLYPDALASRIDALEHDYDHRLGVESRRWVYFHWKAAPPREVLRIAGQGTPVWERALAPVVIPFVLKFIENKLDVGANQVQAGRGIIDETFDRVANLLDKGQAFLCGDRFTAADLSFACMAAPLVMPAEYGIRLPTADRIPEAARADFERYRAHPAGQYAMRLFQAYRRY